jgi:alkylhydroperoxidase family enzyme
MDPEAVAKAIEDESTAPIDEKLRATLRVLRKMTLDPEGLTADDVRPALAAGVSRRALQDAIHVAFLFNIYDRLADTMGWDVPALESGFYRSSARRLLERGYG